MTSNLAGWDKYGEEVSKEVTCYLPLGIRAGDVVMDVGAHHGHFALLAVQEGAKAVHCFEPAPENLVYLSQNVSNIPEVSIKSCALGRTRERRILWLNPGRNTGAHSLVKRRGRQGVEIEVLPFVEEYLRVNPDIVKIDIEGAEYELDLHVLASARAVAIELHLQGHQRLEAQRIHRYIQSLGFTVVRAPRDTGKNWHSYAIYSKTALPSLT